MRLAKVIGKVWATAKDDSLRGLRFSVIQPLNYRREPEGGTLVAIDAIGAGEDETVFYVGGADATLAFPGRSIPSDASIVGIVDRVHT
ncbi:MAG: EutN/CcmL family microcompartment protein [candidate division Zixibacteria bacterium]|nr:EutN/CcmL family microcompartment protein [candidate division Zixibacteria bacterium]